MLVSDLLDQGLVIMPEIFGTPKALMGCLRLELSTRLRQNNLVSRFSSPFTVFRVSTTSSPLNPRRFVVESKIRQHVEPSSKKVLTSPDKVGTSCIDNNNCHDL